MLLGIPGDNTYSNYQEATRSFWRQTVLPLVTRTAKALSTWLSPAYGVRPSGSDTSVPPLELRPDLDAIEALSPEREALWTRIDKATFLTQNEKRAAVGYGPVEGGDAVKGLADRDLAHKYPGQPRIPGGQSEGGQYTFGPNPDGPQPAAGRRLFGPRGPVRIPPGATIRNKDLAGKKHPDTGIPFDSQGFPDFSGVATHSVTVPHQGTPADYAAANRAAGLASTPPGMVWHHHQDGRTMQLLPEEIHKRTGHTGSRGIRNLPGKR
jgi:hypothetical protein